MIVTFEDTYLEELYTQGKTNDKNRSKDDSQQSETF